LLIFSSSVTARYFDITLSVGVSLRSESSSILALRTAKFNGFAIKYFAPALIVCAIISSLHNALKTITFVSILFSQLQLLLF
jgi:hypothetical protein